MHFLSNQPTAAQHTKINSEKTVSESSKEEIYDGPQMKMTKNKSNAPGGFGDIVNRKLDEITKASLKFY